VSSQLKPRLFYGWVMVATGAVIQLMTGGLLNQSYGAYVVVLAQDMGWSKTTLSAAFSLVRFESDLLGPVEGWLIDRFGPRAVMRAGLVILGLGFITFSQIDSLVAFYLAFGIIALGSSLGGFFPLTVAVVQWFHRRRATALATMQTGFALGGLTVPIIVFCLENFGWRATAFASGLLVIAVGVPLAQLIRRRPEDYGLEVDGGPPRVDPGRPNAQPARHTADAVDFRLGEALRTPAFWLISLGHGSALLVVAAMQVHLVPHLHDYLGYSLPGAAFVVSFMTGAQIVGQLAGGVLGDRFSKRAICAVCMGMHMTGLLLVTYATSLPMVLGFAVLHGVAWGVRGPMMQAIRADYFGRAAFGVIMGTSSLIVTIGNTSGPLIAGFLADQTGNYQSGFTVLALLAGMGSLFFVFSARPRPPSRLREPEEIRD
jgi:sugar phosphate permease